MTMRKDIKGEPKRRPETETGYPKSPRTAAAEVATEYFIGKVIEGIKASSACRAANRAEKQAKNRKRKFRSAALTGKKDIAFPKRSAVIVHSMRTCKR